MTMQTFAHVRDLLANADSRASDQVEEIVSLADEVADAFGLTKREDRDRILLTLVRNPGQAAQACRELATHFNERKVSLIGSMAWGLVRIVSVAAGLIYLCFALLFALQGAQAEGDEFDLSWGASVAFAGVAVAQVSTKSPIGLVTQFLMFLVSMFVVLHFNPLGLGSTIQFGIAAAIYIAACIVAYLATWVPRRKSS